MKQYCITCKDYTNYHIQTEFETVQLSDNPKNKYNIPIKTAYCSICNSYVYDATASDFNLNQIKKIRNSLKPQIEQSYLLELTETKMHQFPLIATSKEQAFKQAQLLLESDVLSIPKTITPTQTITII